MASLVEELVSVLREEEKIYRTFLEYGEEKRQILIEGNISALERLTSIEQDASDNLLQLSNKQTQILQDVATVLGLEQDGMTVTRLIDSLGSQPETQKELQDARNQLMDTAGKVQTLNQQNEVLIRQAIELTEFDIALFKSLRQAPETANYDRYAANTGALLGSSGFDTKQ